MLPLTQYYLKTFNPAFKAWSTRLLYLGRRVAFGSGLKADTIPRIIVDENASLTIGYNVELRRNIEIRVHGTAQVVIGNNVRIDRGVRILAANNATIEIKDGARVGLYTVFNGGDSITVGRNVLISGFVYLQTSMHRYKAKSKSVQEQGYDHAPVVLEDDTWLGTHVVILPGVTIGKGSVVGSNAVVTSNVGSYQVVAGVPAKPIKERE